MERTPDEIVKEYLEYWEERRQMEAEPTQPMSVEQLKEHGDRLKTWWESVDVEELERSVERYREDHAVAEAILDLRAELEKERFRREQAEDHNKTLRDDVKEYYRESKRD